MSMERYQNRSLEPEKRAELLLEELDLDEKLAQTGCYFGIAIKGNDKKKKSGSSAHMELEVYRHWDFVKWSPKKRRQNGRGMHKNRS